MSRLPSQGRLLSSHSQNSVLFSNAQQDYDFQQSSSSLPSNHIIFNQSFYKQKELLSQQQQPTKQLQNFNKKELFLSLEFVRKYFDTHSIEPIVSKTIKAILDTDYLPQNPYNMMYRILMPDALLLNSIHFYSSQTKTVTKKINSNIKSLSIEGKKSKTNNPANTDPWMEQILTKRIQIADKQFFISSKMARYVHPNALYIIWTEVASKSRLNTINELLTKHKLLSYYLSIGGPALLLLEGVSSYSQSNEIVKLSLKVNQPLSLSSYTGQTMLEVGYYITVPADQPSLTLTNFCNFVIQESLQQMQNNPNDIYMFLTKLSVGITDKQAIVQWSTSQLIHERVKIVKEIVKLLLTQKCQLKTTYYVKSTKKMSATLFQDYFTLTKTYILISPINQSEQQMNSTKKSAKQQSPVSTVIYTPTPLSFMFEHFFVVPHYYECLDKAYGLNSIKNELIFLQYRKEKFKKIISDIKLHSLTNASYNLFFLSLYDTSISPLSYQNIIQALNLVINNPLNFLSRTIHQLKLCKIILNPTASSLTSNSEAHLYQTLQSIQTMFYEFQKESDHPYPQIYVAFQTLRKLLSVILTKQKFRVNIIKLLLDYAILCLRGVVNSFVGIAWSVTGTLHQYLIELDKSLGNQQSHTVIQQTITYDHYLSTIKSLPHRALYLPDEIKRYKQQLGTTQNQTRDLIYAKYLQHYQVYQQLYGFYWNLIEGKKIDYPLSQLMEVIKTKAMVSEAQIMEKEMFRLRKINQNSNKSNSKITLNRISGIQIYEMSKGANNEFAFYSYTKDSLNQSALVQYRKFYQKFLPFFQQSIQNLTSLTGKAKYILSLKNLPFLNEFSQESSGIYITTLYADLIIKRQLKKQQLINIIYNQLTQFMENVDKDDIGVLGVYASWRNLGNASIVYHGDSDQIYAQASFESTSFLKFDYKRKLPFQQFYKFLQHCITAGKQIQVRLIYKDQKVIQSCNVTFNVYFYQGQDQSSLLISNRADQLLKPLIEIGGWQDRVFYGSKDIIEWGIMNNVASKKNDTSQKSQPKISSIQKISPTKSKPSSQTVTNSMKKILQQQQVLIEQLILQSQDLPLTSQQLTSSTLRLLSPSYTNLQQSHHHLLTLLYLLTYIKHDRRNRFQFPFITDQVSLIEYYLMVLIDFDNRNIAQRVISLSSWKVQLYRWVICQQLSRDTSSKGKIILEHSGKFSGLKKLFVELQVLLRCSWSMSQPKLKNIISQKTLKILNDLYSNFQVI